MLLKIGGLIITNLDVGPSRRYNFWACFQGHFQVDLAMEAKSTLSVNCTVSWVEILDCIKRGKGEKQTEHGYPSTYFPTVGTMWPAPQAPAAKLQLLLIYTTPSHTEPPPNSFFARLLLPGLSSPQWEKSWTQYFLGEFCICFSNQVGQGLKPHY